MTDTPSTDEHTGPVWFIRTALSWALLLAVLAVGTVVILVPAVAGAERFTVLTGSMEPTYPPGTLIVVRPAEEDQLRVGDAITYQLKTGETTVVTHRIVAASQNTMGERSYTTQGDANDAPDAKPVIAEQVRGKVWYSIPYLGYVNNWLTGQHRAWVIGAVVAGLFSYAIVMAAGGIRDGRRARREGGSSGEAQHHAARL